MMSIKTVHGVMERGGARTGSSRQMTGTAAAVAVGAMTVAGSLASSAYAQAPASQAGEQLAEVVVTASRVARTGFTAPTPTTVVSEEQIERRAAINIGETLNELPAFRQTSSPTTNSNQPLPGVGQTQADLRGLGSVRTLTLVNGRRHVPTATTGQVDLGLIPTILVERAEVVTGGASAAWGSDAVAGVVNLILKNKLQGFETTAQYGITDRSDDETWLFGVAAGTGFNGDRGHFMIGGEFSDSDGVAPYNGLNGGRDWQKNRGPITNPQWQPSFFAPANGLPANIYGEDFQFASMTPGGIITGAPPNAASLLGLAFGPGGSVYRFQPGVGYGDGQMLGGEQPGINAAYGMNLKAPVKRYSALSHVDYELTDSLNAFLEVSAAEVEVHVNSIVPRDFGPSFFQLPFGIPPVGPNGGQYQGLIIARTDNPFMPATLRTQMQTLGVPAVLLGRHNDELGQYTADFSNQTQRYVFGLDGKFGGNGNWTWDAYYQYGRNSEDDVGTGLRVTSRWLQAIDVVADANGQPVCRSTLANPSNGCVPYNIFGPGVSSQAARDYVTTGNSTHTEETQQVAAANLQGELFQLSTGPAVLATGVEWRKEELAQSADQVTLKGDTNFGTFFIPTNGSLSVKEFYAELVTPLVKDAAFAKAVDLDLAGRYTEYSTSGGVTTWKAGLTWDVNDQVRFRGSVSRDIRAANVTELFAAQGISVFFANDKILGTQPGFATTLSSGNPDLEPETGTTYTAGVVFQSPGRTFRTSLDYYRIEIEDQIVSLGGQDIVDRCALGLTAYCSQIHRNPEPFGPIASVDSPYQNLIGFRTSGVDFEAAYSHPLSAIPGEIVVQAFANYTHELTRIDEVGEVNRVGQVAGTTPGVPDWQANVTLAYNLGGFSGSVQARIVHGGELDTQAKPGTATSANIYTVPSGYLWNLAASYDFDSGSSARKVQVFGLIDNVTDEHPPFPIVQSSYYDAIGRTYRVGVRLKY